MVGWRPLASRMSSTLWTNSNGEYGDGSSNKTPYMVGPIRVPPLVAHVLQLFHASWWWGMRKAGERREHLYSTARGIGIQGPEVPWVIRRDAGRRGGRGPSLRPTKTTRVGPRYIYTFIFSCRSVTASKTEGDWEGH